MIEVDLATILTITGAILAPLLTVIGAQYLQNQKERERSDTLDEKRIEQYNTMRDRMQEKIDTATQRANDAISTVTTALNAMSQALASRQEKQGEEWNRLKEDIVRAIRDGK